jgi:hypothetical protein
MKVIKVNGDDLSFFEMNEGEIKFSHNTHEPDIIQLGTKVVLILDYDSYFDLNSRKNLLTVKLSPLKINPSNIYSPYETIGAYLKNKNPDIDGDIQAIDIETAYCRSFRVRFVDGKYTLSKEINEEKNIPAEQLFDKYLQKSASQIQDFERFLKIQDTDGKTFGLMVWEGIREYENGNDEYNELIAAFDHNEWADITITKLVALKTHILREAAIDTSKPYAFVGILSSIFSATYDPDHPLAKLHGAWHLYESYTRFYARSSASIALEVYCYPNLVKVPLYEANSPFQKYSVPKQIQLFDAGNIVIYRDNEPVKITTGSNTIACIDLEIHLDGNQNLLVNVGSNAYLL